MFCSSFLFTAPSTTGIYTLSLHDALPILARIGRQFFHGFAHSIQFFAVSYAEAVFSGGKSAKQRYKAGSEQHDVDEHAQGNGPPHNQVGPKKRQDKEVGPNNDLDVIPFPRRQFYQVTDEENRDRRDKESDRGGDS